MFEKILVAVEGPQSGNASQRYAAELSRALHASAEVFFTAPPRGVTLHRWEHQMASSIAREAEQMEADLIVFRPLRHSVRRHHGRRVMRELTRLAPVPVMSSPILERQDTVHEPASRPSRMRRLAHV
jgi:hypothetical protein